MTPASAPTPQDNGVSKIQNPSAKLPEKDFQVVSRDWNGRKVKYGDDNLSLDEMIDVLKTKVWNLDSPHRPELATEADKIELKNQIRAMIAVVKDDSGLSGLFSSSVKNRQRLADLDGALHHKNLHREKAPLPKKVPRAAAPLPKEPPLPRNVIDALQLLDLDKIPNTRRELFQRGYSYKGKTTPEEYKEIVQATQTILTYLQAQKKRRAT